MNFLVTGANGFLGRNLVERLKNIKNGIDKTRSFTVGKIFECTRKSSEEELQAWCKEADFVFNLVGVSRPKDNGEFKIGNYDFVEHLLDLLKKNNNKCSVMLASSIQASLIGRFKGSEYGKTKRDAENLLFNYAKNENVKVFVYRFPHMYGKWGRPNYNSVIATFCNNIANNLPIMINDPSVILELVYVDDVIDSMFSAIEGNACRCKYTGITAVADQSGDFCYVPCTHKLTVGELADILKSFRTQSENKLLQEISENSFRKKLYSTYLSYLPNKKDSLS